MPLDCSIKKVLVIGAGPIVIGQACEFDYAGTQACKALREEGCKMILLNSNPATIMTDSADAVYIDPITPQMVENIIRRERPDALLPTMGGQTALNCARESASILEKYGVRLIGLTLETLEKAENRSIFQAEMEKIGLEVPKSYSAHEAEFPVIVRRSFTLGGQGGGVAHDFEELERLCQGGELLIEESLIGWKEFELEVIRDRKGNCIVVCGIENIDPMGIHTGDSLTVAPIQTLTDKEYQLMRKKAFQILEAIGMTGGCNVQFAVDPKTGRMLVIEVNPRVSRSSALASKATGYPIAKIAAKLALGYHLDELYLNNLMSWELGKEVPSIFFPERVTIAGRQGTSEDEKLKVKPTKTKTNSSSCLGISYGTMPAFFEPVIDYVAVKIPRFNFEKFPEADRTLTTHMKSVGEAMGIGSTFKEALNKAISSLDAPWHPRGSYDPWFTAQIDELMAEEEAVKLLETIDLYRLKRMGFSDARLAALLKCGEEQIAERRKELGLYPVYKRIDSCSGEFQNEIACLYSTYEEECESAPTGKPKILVLGSGPNRIGQGIEFDYCCVHAIKAIREMGYESILINCNPETVSTDYDTADRLYFEPLTLEHVREVIRIEKPLRTLISFGGQTPLNIGRHLGLTPPCIDLAEDREKFRLFAAKIGLKQPQNAVFSTPAEASQMAKIIGFPLILRPSYVIGGSGMQIIRNEKELEAQGPLAAPVLMEAFLEGAMEVEVDAISDGKEVFICGIVEQVEPAGIHSGDSMSFLSPYKLSKQFQEALVEQTRRIALSLQVVGLLNVQFAIHNGEIFVLEVNPRASRTIPLLSKTTGLPLVQMATKCLLGLPLESGIAEPKFLGLKLPVFPFSRLHIEEKLGPQMKSTGEVLCTGRTFEELFAKARLYALQDKHLFTKDLESKLSPNR